MDGRKNVKTAKAALEASQKAVADNETAMHELTRKVEKYEARKTSAQRVLEGGGGDPEAAERQVAQVESILDELETEQLERMEAAETLDVAEKAAQTHLEDITTDLADKTEAHPGSVAELRAEYDRILPERDAVFAELDRSTQQKYEGLVARKKWAVSPMVDGSCKACNRFVQPQHLADMKRGLLQPCRGCGRWLRVDADP